MDKRRRIQGVVFSNKNDKTIGVMLSGYKKHSKYLKRVQFRSKYYADDPKNEAKIGDVVTIEECRPISKTKRFKLISIDKKAFEKVEIAEDTQLVKALHDVIGKFGATEVFLKPAPEGTGIIAGGPVRAILELAGIKNVYSKVYGSRTSINVVRATVAALDQLKDYKVVQELRGLVTSEGGKENVK